MLTVCITLIFSNKFFLIGNFFNQSIFRTVKLPVFTNMIKTMKVRADRMRKGATGGFTNATDAADYLVKKGMSEIDAATYISEKMEEIFKK